MDVIRRIAAAAFRFLLDHGVFVIAGTTTLGIALGPEGALLGGIAAGAGSFLGTERWARIVRWSLIAVQAAMPTILEHGYGYFMQFMNNVAELIIRLLRKVHLLPQSTVMKMLEHGSDKDNNDDDDCGSQKFNETKPKAA